MGLFGFGRQSSLQLSNYKNLVDGYNRLRLVRLRLNQELASRLSADVLREGAKQLGILRGDAFVFNDEDETAVLMDYCIYDVFRKGRNAVDQYLCDSPPDPDSEEMTCLRAMQHATFAVIVMLRAEPGVGCHVRNMFTAQERLLVDMGLSTSAQPGGVLVTRLLDFGDYITTSGAPMSLGILPGDQLDVWQRKLRLGRTDDNADPAPMIRECLRRGATSNVVYAGTDSRSRPKASKMLPRVEDPVKRKRELTQHQANKSAATRRCRCGSGKMFKNCCGKCRSPK